MRQLPVINIVIPLRDIANDLSVSEFSMLLNEMLPATNKATLDMGELDEDGRELVRRMYEELIDEELSS